MVGPFFQFVFSFYSIFFSFRICNFHFKRKRRKKLLNAIRIVALHRLTKTQLNNWKRRFKSATFYSIRMVKSTRFFFSLVWQNKFDWKFTFTEYINLHVPFMFCSLITLYFYFMLIVQIKLFDLCIAHPHTRTHPIFINLRVNSFKREKLRYQQIWTREREEIKKNYFTHWSNTNDK